MQGRLLETQDILQRFILEPKNEAQAQNIEVDTVDGLAAMHSGDVDSRFFGELDCLASCSRSSLRIFWRPFVKHKVAEYCIKGYVSCLQNC
jgi:hypothetical protein